MRELQKLRPQFGFDNHLILGFHNHLVHEHCIPLCNINLDMLLTHNECFVILSYENWASCTN